MKPETLLKNKGYLLKMIQYEIFDAIRVYLEEHKMNQTDLANKLNVSKSYVSQVMNAKFDHKLSKLVDLAIAMGKVPVIQFEDVKHYEWKAGVEATSPELIQDISGQHSTDDVDLGEKGLHSETP